LLFSGGNFVKQITLNTPYEEDKINAIRQFTDEEKPSIEQELTALIDRLYQKNVPAPVREFIAARADAPAPGGSNRRKNRTDNRSEYRAESASATAQNSADPSANDDGSF
jgi:hypothetical protein